MICLSVVIDIKGHASNQTLQKFGANLSVERSLSNYTNANMVCITYPQTMKKLKEKENVNHIKYKFGTLLGHYCIFQCPEAKSAMSYCLSLCVWNYLVQQCAIRAKYGLENLAMVQM